MRLWSPELVIQGNDCYVTFSISTPAEVHFLLETRPSSAVIRTSTEVLSIGYYGGIFAGDGSVYVGDLAHPGEFAIWFVLKDGAAYSNVYYFEFVIPSMSAVLISCSLFPPRVDRAPVDLLHARQRAGARLPHHVLAVPPHAIHLPRVPR